MKFNNKNLTPYKDQFNYYNLVQKINPSYRVFFDRVDKQFKLVNVNKNNEVCMCFNSFSNNIISNLRFSQIENFTKILSYIDDENEKTSIRNSLNLKQNSKDVIQEFHKITNRSSTIDKNDINKIIGAAKC